MAYSKLSPADVAAIKVKFEELQKKVELICSADFFCYQYPLSQFDQSIMQANRWAEGMIIHYNEYNEDKSNETLKES
jgi:hypothetical protein